MIEMGREDVLNIARIILSQCDHAISKDKKGYDRFDAFTVRDILYPDIFGNSDISDEEVEYLREKLLRYRTQLREIAMDYGYSELHIEIVLHKLEEPICENSILIRGRAEGTDYGRISYKWFKEKFEKGD